MFAFCKKVKLSVQGFIEELVLQEILVPITSGAESTQTLQRVYRGFCFFKHEILHLCLDYFFLQARTKYAMMHA